jgi:hypothetical protein
LLIPIIIPTMKRTVRQGPVKLDEDDNVIPAATQAPPQDDGKPADDLQQRPATPVVASPDFSRQQQSMLGGWFAKVSAGFDKLYELANQPVQLRDPSDKHSGEAAEDRHAAAETLDELLKRAKEGGGDGTASPNATVDSAAPVSHAAAASAITGSPPPTDTQQPRSLQQGLKEHIGRLSKQTATLASKARDHWQNLSAVDRTVDRSIDDAFRLYGVSAELPFVTC